MIRVLIVDDSTLFRKILKTGLENDPDFEVIGEASHGAEAVELAKQLKPDVITMDVVMPGVDGFRAIQQIMSERPTPILVISSLKRDEIVFRMLAIGALDVVAKPEGDLQSLTPLIERLKALAATRVRYYPIGVPDVFSSRASSTASTGAAALKNENLVAPVIVIAASAGGPQALMHILSHLPVNFPAAVLVVQHISAGFAQGLADWLKGLCALPVRLAQANQVLSPGMVVVAPDSKHTLVGPGRRIVIDAGVSPPASVRPAADIAFRSAAEVCRDDLLAVVLTGMGRDGAVGAEVVRAHGGQVVVQNQATSMVYGMPQAARPFANAELPLEEIAAYLTRFARDHSR